MTNNSQQLAIDAERLAKELGRDLGFQPYSYEVYIDRRTRQFVQVYDNDEEANLDLGIPQARNREDRQRVSAEPDRYVRIPGLTHQAHHEILQEFLNSDWTDDERARQRALDAYNRSIGNWRDAVGDQAVVRAFDDFRDAKIQQSAREFLSRALNVTGS